MSKYPPIPGVPPAQNGATRMFLRAVRDALTLLVGQSRTKMDRAVTFNDLVALGLATRETAEAQAKGDG